MAPAPTSHPVRHGTGKIGASRLRTSAVGRSLASHMKREGAERGIANSPGAPAEQTNRMRPAIRTPAAPQGSPGTPGHQAHRKGQRRLQDINCAAMVTDNPQDIHCTEMVTDNPEGHKMHRKGHEKLPRTPFSPQRSHRAQPDTFCTAKVTLNSPDTSCTARVTENPSRRTSS